MTVSTKVWVYDTNEPYFTKHGYYSNSGGFMPHKVGSPAIIQNVSGQVKWYMNGFRYFRVTDYCAACCFTDEETLMWVLKYGDWLPRNKDDL